MLSAQIVAARHPEHGFVVQCPDCFESLVAQLGPRVVAAATPRRPVVDKLGRIGDEGLREGMTQADSALMLTDDVLTNRVGEARTAAFAPQRRDQLRQR